MSDIYGRVMGERGALTQLMSKIPGFSGYAERESRRAADQLLREMVATRFEEQWQRISRSQRELISQGQISLIDDLEAAAIKLRQFADRVRHATYGYAGFFAAVKVNEEELAGLYDYDLNLLSMADEVTRAVDNLEGSIGTDGLPAAIRHLVTTAERTLDLYNHRAESILTMSQPGSSSITPTTPAE